MSLLLGLNQSLLLGLFGSLSSLLSSFPRCILLGLLLSNLHIFLNFNLIFNLNSLSINLIVPLFGVMIVVAAWGHVQGDIISVVFVGDGKDTSKLKVLILFSLFVHDVLDFLRLIFQLFVFFQSSKFPVIQNLSWTLLEFIWAHVFSKIISIVFMIELDKLIFILWHELPSLFVHLIQFNKVESASPLVVDWFKTVSKVIGVVFMFVHNHPAVWSLVVMMVPSFVGEGSLGGFLNIISKSVLGHWESSLVAVWRKFNIMMCLMIVSNSWKVFWSIDNIWVIGRVKIMLTTMIFGFHNSLVLIIQFPPVLSAWGFFVHWSLMMVLMLILI